MAKRFDKKKLCQEWVHSGEEDTQGESIFRPATYDFPLTRRPRESFQLGPDGHLKKGEATPTDQVKEAQGTWHLNNDEITFHVESKPAQSRVITSLEPNKLVLKK